VSNKKNCSIDSISKYLREKLNAIEITLQEFISKSECICDNTFNNVAKVYKIENENIIQSLLNENEKSEILITIKHLKKNNIMEDKNESYCSLYTEKISTGKLIMVILESEDKINLSGFTMEGNGQKLYDYLISLIDGDIEKNPNIVDEVIEELNHFRPLGKYF
jgi:hypothetical protein